MDSYFQLQDKLLGLCSLPPQPFPRSVKDGSDGLCKLVCGNDEVLSVTFHEKLNVLLPRNIDAGEDITFFAKLDPQKKCLSVYRAQKTSQETLNLRNVDLFFENQVNSGAGAGKPEIRKFLASNKMDTDNLHLAQECYSMAYAMQVLLRNLPNLKTTVNGVSVPVSTAASVEKILVGLFVEKKENKSGKVRKKAPLKQSLASKADFSQKNPPKKKRKNKATKT